MKALVSPTQNNSVPHLPRPRYRAGSLAKPITALLVLAQQAEGALDIDQPLSADLPGFRLKPRFDQAARPITPRQLLSHHAGLPSDLNKGLWSEQPFTTVRKQLRDEYAAFPPNLLFGYSNLGYSLLGDLVQTLTETPFPRTRSRRCSSRSGCARPGLPRAPSRTSCSPLATAMVGASSRCRCATCRRWAWRRARRIWRA